MRRPRSLARALPCSAAHEASIASNGRAETRELGVVIPIGEAADPSRAERASSGGAGGVEGGKARVDAMLDLQPLPATERWAHVQAMVRRLEDEHAGQWRIKLLVSDAPEEGHDLPRLLEQLTQAGLRYDATRELSGMQSIVVCPLSAPLLQAAV